MFGIGKYMHQEKKLIITNNNLNENNMDLGIILPGHYCENSTINAEVKNIIRIIGPDKQKEGYWLTQDGKSLHESLILDSYTRLDTKSTDKPNIRKKNIMADFRPIKPKEDSYGDSYDDSYKNSYEAKSKEDSYDDSYKNSYEAKPIPETFKPVIRNVENKPKEEKPDKFKTLNFLLSKSHIDNLNKNYMEKYGTEPYKPTIIEIPLKIEVPYDFDKLSQICELFDISINDVAELIYQSINLPKHVILSDIINHLTIKHQNIPEKKIVIPESNFGTKLDTTTNQQNNEEIVEKGISEVDEYLLKLFNGE